MTRKQRRQVVHDAKPVAPMSVLAQLLTPARIDATGRAGREGLWRVLAQAQCQCTAVVDYLTPAGLRHRPARVDRCRRLVGHPGPHYDLHWREADLAPMDAQLELLALSAMHGNTTAAKALQWSVTRL